MQHPNTHQNVVVVSLITSPLEGEDVRRTKEGVLSKLFMTSPLPAFGHSRIPTFRDGAFPQGARRTTRAFTARSVIPQCRYAGYSGRIGFTLIELLVVILIIGILAAVALPQYQKAVDRARFVQLVTYVDALVKAQHIYFLANGTYAENIQDVDIQVKNTPDIFCSFYSSYVSCRLKHSNGSNVATLEEDFKGAWKQCCSYKGTNYMADVLCASEMETSSWHNGCSKDFPCHCYVKQ